MILGKIRIAQVPYAMSLALEKKKVLEQVAKAEIKTVAQNKKGGVRVAHVPQIVSDITIMKFIKLLLIGSNIS